MFTIDNFIKGITYATRNLSASTQDNLLILTRTYHDYQTDEDHEEIVAKISLDELEHLSASLSEDYLCADIMLIKKDYIEVAVQSLDRSRPPLYMRSEQGSFAINEHNYKFITSKASMKYIFALFCYFSHYPEKYDITPFRMRFQEENITIEELFDSYRIFTARIESPQKHSTTELKRIFDSYLFNISYNYNTSLAIADFSVDRRLYRAGARRGGRLFPYKSYKPDLTKYYHQAIATNLPFMQYLAFYHVAEFFFQSISEDDAFQVISNFITRPSFSPYKQDDLRVFYNMIKKMMREQRDDGVWNEKNGLLLCLKKFVPDLNILKRSIESIDSSAIDHYKTTHVTFTDDSKTVDFNDNVEKIYLCIRDRVYSTRNAIVHSKSGERLRYEPFKHDKQLAKEIPLIRAIAEEIIINSADKINYSFINTSTE